MINRQLYILLVILICSTVFVQCKNNKNYNKSFEKIFNSYKDSYGQFNSVTSSSLWKTDDFKISISKNPITFNTIHLVIENPYYSDKFYDFFNNYKNYPVSYSVIYERTLISLFRNGKFICYNLVNLQRDSDFEEKLNTEKIEYHWIIDNKLGGLSGDNIYIWKNNNWEKTEMKFPLIEQPKFFEDTNYVVFGVQPKLFEDSSFIVFSDCHGEWGGTVYFFDKVSGDTYFTESTCANTVYKKDNKYVVLSHLGHGMGSAKVKEIKDPRKLSKAKKDEINKTKEGQALGYTDKSNAYKKALDFYWIQLFSTFQYEGRQLYIVHSNNLTFIAEINGCDIQIVHPLFDNDIYTHNPVTTKYENYTLINLDFYGTALDKEVSLIIIDKDRNRIIKLDWNENHCR